MAEETIVSLGELIPDPANARVHNPRNVGTIADAIQEVGFGRSVLIDEENVVLAGNATIEAAGQAGLEKVRIVDADGDEVIAVRRKNLTPVMKARIALFDNRAAELAEGWDIEVIKRMEAEGVPLEGLWTDEELRALLDAIPEAEETEEEDPDLGDEESPGEEGDEEDLGVAVGPYRFILERQEFKDWELKLKQDMAAELECQIPDISKEIVVAEIRRRLNL
jgi:hypothetical protein